MWKRKRKSMIIVMVVLVGLAMVIGGFLSSNHEEIESESTIIVESISVDKAEEPRELEELFNLGLYLLKLVIVLLTIRIMFTTLKSVAGARNNMRF